MALVFLIIHLMFTANGCFLCLRTYVAHDSRSFSLNFHRNIHTAGITGTSDAALNSSAMPMPDTNAPTIVSTDVTPSNLYPTPTHPSLIALRDRKIIWTGKCYVAVNGSAM